jgi:hypothetical protein
MKIIKVIRLTAFFGAVCAIVGCGGDSDSAPTARPTESSSISAEIVALEQAVAAARTRVERLRDFEELENLAGIYGFYVDKNLHNDVADLFAEDGVVEILGRGVYIGQDRVREYMLNLSPVGPSDGRLFNHMHMQPVIHVADDGMTANMRARLVVMYGIADTQAQWGGGVYENQLVKEDGIWKFKYLHAYQTFYTLYEDGWANQASAIFAPYDRLPPDRPQSVPYDPYPAAFVPPFHYVNPVTGRDDYYADPALREPE